MEHNHRDEGYIFRIKEKACPYGIPLTFWKCCMCKGSKNLCSIWYGKNRSKPVLIDNLKKYNRELEEKAKLQWKLDEPYDRELIEVQKRWINTENSIKLEEQSSTQNDSYY